MSTALKKKVFVIKQETNTINMNKEHREIF